MTPVYHSVNVKPTYIKYNYFAIFVHFISFVAMIVIYSNVENVIFPYTESYIEWNECSKNTTCPPGARFFETSDNNFCIGPVTKPVYCNGSDCYGLDLGWLVISFHILSFSFQFFAALSDVYGPFFGYKYSDLILENKNPLRFIEYSISASIMLISIALINGVTDINLIASIAILTACCQLCGLAVEYTDTYEIKMLLHFTGWLQFICAYSIIGHAFIKSITSSDDGPPNFVYIIVILIFLLYSSFGFVQLYEVCLPLHPYTKEKIYVLLSLTSKLFLGWMIFSNVLILGN